MKFLKQILDLIRTLFKTWPYLVIIIGWLLSGFLWLIKIGQTVVILSLPLSLLIVIVTLALYPVAKVIQLILQKLKKPPFEFSGLLWKPSFIGYPRPFCPLQGCGKKIFHKIQKPPPIQVVRPTDWNRINLMVRNIYECPIHGRIETVPDWPFNELKQKAKSVQ